jgi:excisionase family DNA binding protein
MDPNQTKIIELLREVHLIAVKEIDRLNLRIAELESTSRRQPEAVVTERPAKPPFPSKSSEVEMMNEQQVADYLNTSVGVMRKWRLFRKGPRFAKIGRAVRYRRQDVDAWLDSCSGLR